MSSKTDEFKILSVATELIGKHMDLDTIRQVKGVGTEESIKKAYKTSEIALMTHTRQVVTQIKTINDLTNCFHTACYGFAALGMRHDLIYNKLVGTPKSGQDMLCDAIEKDTKLPDGLEGLPVFRCDYEQPYAYNLSLEAFNDSNSIFEPDNTSKKALTVTILLDYIQNSNGVILNAGAVLEDILQHLSCLRVIANKNWQGRSLIGYFMQGEFICDVTNRDFLSIFAGKLKGLLIVQKNTFTALQINKYLHEQVISMYTDFSNATPLKVYDEIDRLITADKTSDGITQELINCTYYSEFAVVKNYGNHGVKNYVLNIEGLQALANLLETLNLGGLAEVAMIIDKIRAVCVLEI